MIGYVRDSQNLGRYSLPRTEMGVFTMVSLAPLRNQANLTICGFLALALCISSLASETVGGTADGSPVERPNIVLIMADDLGIAGLGCYGQRKIETPRIDELARRGVRFTQAYAGSHVCQPSRSVLMTGLHAGHTPCRANDVNQVLLDQDRTIAELLKDRGYTTGMFGKWGLGTNGSSGDPNRQGFDLFVGQKDQVHAHFYYPAWIWENDRRLELKENLGAKRGSYVQDVIHKRALQFMRDHRDGPFFAYLPYILPHVELVVPDDSEAPYRGKFPKQSIQDPRSGYIGSEDGYATFAGMVARQDAYVGEVMDLLDELGISEQTIVIFTSDNGGQSGGADQGWTKMTDFFQQNGSYRGYKGSFYEGGIRVPFIVSWPGQITPASSNASVMTFADVLPTLLEFAGAEISPALDGDSFAERLTTAASKVWERDKVFYWEYPLRSGLSRAARCGNWKAVQPRPDNNVELYNLASDPTESEDLAKRHPEILQSLIEAMDQAHSPPREYPQTIKRPSLPDFVY